jgi:hypothetical protein
MNSEGDRILYSTYSIVPVYISNNKAVRYEEMIIGYISTPYGYRHKTGSDSRWF